MPEENSLRLHNLDRFEHNLEHLLDFLVNVRNVLALCVDNFKVVKRCFFGKLSEKLIASCFNVYDAERADIKCRTPYDSQVINTTNQAFNCKFDAVVPMNVVLPSNV